MVTCVLTPRALSFPLMAKAYYTCNLLPTELLSRCGYVARWLGNHLQDPAAPARRDALGVHPMTCPYVTRLVVAADMLLDGAPDGDCLLVPGGCDAMRRMGDLLAATYPDRVFVLPMPRSSGDGVVRTLAADLLRMESWLRERLESAAPPDGARPEEGVAPETDLREATAPGPAPGQEPSGVDYPSPPRPGGVFVVAGPLSDASLLELIDRLGGGIAGLESCTSPERWKPLVVGAPGTAADKGGEAGGQAGGEAGDDHVALAARLLDIGMCPRRSTADRRAHLARRLDESRPSSVIYARQSFCDPGAYDALAVAALAEERGLPYLEIEVGFPFEPGGPLRTRVEAFLEAQSLDDDLLDDDLVDDAGFTGDDPGDGEA